jgi:hypothetical protein
LSHRFAANDLQILADYTSEKIDLGLFITIKIIEIMSKLKLTKNTSNRPAKKPKTIFWKKASNGSVKINQSELIAFLQEGGFYKTTANGGISVVRLVGNVVSEVKDFEIIDFIKRYLIYNKETDVLEAFSTGVSSYINKGKLNLLDTIDILGDRDPKDKSWIYFQNIAVLVDENSVKLVSYEDLSHKIWKSRVLKRDYKSPNGMKSDFAVFLFNLSGQNEERYLALLTIIGYLLHRYQNKSLTKAVIFLDENMSFDGKANGGTGKTLVTEAIGKMRELVGMDGKSMKGNSWFKNQRITPTTDVVRYDDVQSDFSMETLYSMITSGVTVEKKYQDEFYISPENAPKIAISSNFPVKGTGGSTDIRRRCEFEVANHYDANHQPIDDFGFHFFEDWDDKQWNSFDLLMMDCLKAYLKNGLIIPEAINLVKNTLIGGTCYEFTNFINDEIELDSWIDKRVFHLKFMESFPIHKDVSSNQFTRWLKEYARLNNLVYKDKSSGGKYSFILETIKTGDDEE